MQAFRLDRASGIPVKLQFKAQVKYQISIGLLYPGDQLPSLRDLAEGLGINLNTVVRSVDELIAEGFLYSHQGKGIFVADEPPGALPGAALRSTLAGALAPAREWGLTPEELALALLAHGQLARVPQPAGQRLLLVGTARSDLRRLQRELEAALPGVAATPSLPEELGRTTQATLVVATLFHATLAGSDRAIPLATPAEQRALHRLAELPAGSLVAVVAGDWVQAARIRQSLEQGGWTRLRFAMATRTEELSGVLPEAACLLAAQSGRKIAEEAQANRPDLPCLIEPLVFPPEAVAAIRQSLGTLAQPPRVLVRSSWV